MRKSLACLPGRRRLAVILLALVVGGNLLALSRERQRARALRQECLLCQSRLTEALQPIPANGPASFDPRLLSALRKSGYLRTLPLDVGTSPDSARYFGASLDRSAITCKVHSTLAGEVIR